jgi:hypothetical protein
LLYLYIGSGNHDKKILDISKQHGIMELITFNMEGKNMTALYLLVQRMEFWFITLMGVILILVWWNMGR